MVVGHTTIPKFASDFIFAFHMPLFFIASGWCTNWHKLPFGKFVAKRAYNLLIPFVIYSICVLSIGGPIEIFDAEYILGRGWEGYALWFIPVLFLASVVAKIVMTCTKCVAQIILAVLLALGGSILNRFDIILPWAISTVPYATSLIIIGSLFNKWTRYFEKPRIIILIVGFLLTVLISHFFRLDMAWNKIEPVFIKSIGAIAGTAMVFTLSSFVVKYTKHISKVLQSIGRETYIILAFSQIIIMTMKHFFEWNSLIRYTLMVIILIVLKYAKDGINTLAKRKIL